MVADPWLLSGGWDHRALEPEWDGSMPRPRRSTAPAPLKLSVVMAAYNERRTIRAAVADVLGAELPCDLELLVVDDGSSDGTWEALNGIQDERLRLFRHATNLGKGTALRTGRRYATGTHMVPFDADLEYSAADLARLVEAAAESGAPVVLGTRHRGRRARYANRRYAWGNHVLTYLANLAFDAHISDLHTCLKLVSVDLLRTLPLRETGFGVDTELVTALLRRGIHPLEVPISYRARTRAEGKKIGWRDAVGCLAVMGQQRVARPVDLPRPRLVIDLTDGAVGPRPDLA